MNGRLAVAAASCILVGGAAAAAPPAGQAKAAFERLTKLDGSWRSEGKDAAVHVTWRVIAGGAAVLETVSSADRTRVTSATVYSVEGDELVAHHFGEGAVAHPRLVLKAQEPARLRFEVAPADVPKAAHAAALLLVVKGDDVVTLEWTLAGGAKAGKRAVDLKREYLDTLK
ncbi:MAG: hypothetical protein AMXMBFR34_05390 [Myxococcaceae bacterium]